MVKETLFGAMVAAMKDNIKTIKKMGMDSLSGKMAEATRDSGNKVNKMEEESLHLNKEKKK